MNKNSFIPSVNFHLWEQCNMKCGFCFAKFQDVKDTVLPKGHLSKDESINVVRQLADFGFQKITFVGGEPTLCPWLSELIEIAKEKGLTTMIVTNGSNLTDKFLKNNKKYLDWIAISIDSLKADINLGIGRKYKNRIIDENYYYILIRKIKKYNYRLKINTVVNQFNYREIMQNFIDKVEPERWKVIEVMSIQGQNDRKFNKFAVTDLQYDYFISRHRDMISENNDLMKGSYVMVDPAGRFFDNSNGFHSYSNSIVVVGIENAFQEMNYDYTKFVKRKGIYNWKAE